MYNAYQGIGHMAQGIMMVLDHRFSTILRMNYNGTPELSDSSVVTSALAQQVQQLLGYLVGARVIKRGEAKTIPMTPLGIYRLAVRIQKDPTVAYEGGLCEIGYNILTEQAEYKWKPLEN